MVPNLSEQAPPANSANCDFSPTHDLTVSELQNQPVSCSRALAVPTFRQELSQLLQDYPGQWVAYQGDRRLGFAPTKTKLYQECLGRGLAPDEFEVFCIESEMPERVEVNWPMVG